MQAQDYLLLTETSFFILLSLAPTPRHGYAILKEVEAMSAGRVILATGTLYTALRRMLEDGWIERIEDNPPGSEGRERKLYRLTDLGSQILGLETTQPSAAHTYDLMTWVPGEIIGNTCERRALLLPFRSVTYATAQTGRAHYLTLDDVDISPGLDPVTSQRLTGTGRHWGRFSTNRAFSNPALPNDGVSAATAGLPSSENGTCALDRETARVWHTRGYLDLLSRVHVGRSWVNMPQDTCSDFDPIRRLWVMPRWTIGSTSLGTGQLAACDVDNSSTFVDLTLDLTGTIWQYSYARFAGIQYCPPLDCFFMYLGNDSAIAGVNTDRQYIYKIVPPASNPLSNAWTVTKELMTGGTVGTPTIAVVGMFKRFSWVPALKCFCIYLSPDLPMYLYKPAGIS